MVNTCSKIDSCSKVTSILDKDMLESQYKDAIQLTCSKCPDFSYSKVKAKGLKGFLNKSLESARQYTMWDFGLLKICLVLLGIVFGASFPSFFMIVMPGLLALFVISYALLVYITFFKYWK